MQTKSSLKKLNFDELAQLQRANNEATAAFEAAGLKDSVYYQMAVDEGVLINEAIEARKDEAIYQALSSSLEDKALELIQEQGIAVEDGTSVVISVTVTSEGGIVDAKSRVATRKASEAKSSTGGATRGSNTKFNNIVTLLDGEVIEAATASALLQELKDRKIVHANTGDGDSAPRVLNSLVSREIIAKFERVAIEEDNTDETGPATEPTSEIAPSIVEEEIDDIDDEEIDEEESEDNPFV